MGIILAECAECKKKINEAEIHRDYEGIIRCEKCSLQCKLHYIKHRRDELTNWLKNTHLKNIEEMELEIIKLENKLSHLGN